MWSDELTILRRFLRDPDGNIWTEAFLRHLWNDVQKDVQHKTSILEDVIAQRIPDLYHFSYMHDWEWRHLPSKYSQFYQCLRKHDDFTFCHNFETQEISSITSDAVDDGAHWTQPWEAFMGLTPGEEIRMKFPSNFRNVKFIAYDEEPIFATTRKDVQSADRSYLKKTGEPVSYFMDESIDRAYVLYPTPSTSFVDEVEGEGVAFYVEDDSENTDVGTIAIRTGSSESGNIGASVDIVGVTNNILLCYDIVPIDVETASSEIDYPQYLRRYIRYGVLARAYHANTDGRIPSLARLWEQRYKMGINLINRFMRSRKQDRDYRLTTKPRAFRRRRGLPRLPDTYPAI